MVMICVTLLVEIPRRIFVETRLVVNHPDAVGVRDKGMARGDDHAACAPAQVAVADLGGVGRRGHVDHPDRVTIQGPATALEFSLKLVELLFGKEKSQEVAKAMLVFPLS